MSKPAKRTGRPPIGIRAMTVAERARRHRLGLAQTRKDTAARKLVEMIRAAAAENNESLDHATNNEILRAVGEALRKLGQLPPLNS